MKREDESTCICIDLKSFYASVECVERGLDPFVTNLVVADPERSKSTICLAITPAMKSLGIKNRCRVHEIPESVEYITAVPRMQLYIDYSAWIYSIYLKFVAPEDIHVYSIDECFIDVSKYLRLYKKSAREIASLMMEAVYRETGITATAGVGTNLYLAKVAMDIVAKHVDDHIAVLDEISFREKLWNHKPLSDFWGIGGRTQRKLAQYGMNTMGDIAMASLTLENWFFKMFGVDAELMLDHAWGYEPCRMEDIKNYRSKMHSLSSGQVLMRNYEYEEGRVIVKEMTDALVLDLVRKGVTTDSLSLWISYDHKTGHPGSGGTVNLGYGTNSSEKIIKAIDELYTKITNPYFGIRRVNITANRIVSEGYRQFDLFSSPERQTKERSLQNSILEVRKKYGKNALLRCANLLECSTYIERNNQIGGHRA